MEQSRTAWVILGLLAIEDNKSGYDLRKAIESSVGHFWGESYGQLYPALKRLVADGLIAPTSSANGSSKRRQEYSITETGRSALRDWLALPFQNDPPRNEFLLKLFFGREAAPEVTLEHLRELERRNRKFLAQMLEIRSLAPRLQAGSPHLPYWMLTVDLGIVLTEAALKWGESALATLSAAPGPHDRDIPETA